MTIRNKLAKLAAGHGTLTLTLAITGMVVVASDVIVLTLGVFVFGQPLLPDLYQATIAPMILAPPVAYPLVDAGFRGT